MMYQKQDDLYSRDFFFNPYPYYKELRSSGKISWFHGKDKEENTDGMWLVSRYAHAAEFLKHSEHTSKDITALLSPEPIIPFYESMLYKDNDDHLRLRRVAASFFSTHALKSIEPKIKEITETQIAMLLKKDHIDLITDFAEIIPLHVITRIIGIPVEDIPKIRMFSLSLLKGFDDLLATKEDLSEKNAAMDEFTSYLTHLVDNRRNKQSDDMISYLIDKASKGDINNNELAGTIGLLLFAGHETTINLIGNAIWLLLAHPEQSSGTEWNSQSINNLIEETLRFESPAQRSTFRVARNPIDIAGTQIQPGQQVSILIGSANRDEDIFDEPDKFRIDRSPNRHLAFGLGAHNCQGKSLARKEALIAINHFLQIMPRIALCDEYPRWRNNSFTRGLTSLQVSIE